jgi:hypothetical protein
MAILTEEDRLSYRIVFLVAVVVLLAIPVTAVRLFATLVILCYLPAAPFAARTGLPLLSGLALTVTISPIMIALPVMVVMLFGLPAQTAVWAIVGIVMAQFLVYGTQRAFDPTRAERKILIALAVVVIVGAVLALWLPATNTWWRYREDSWFHAAVFHRIANHGLPVVDPYFSPLRLQYMYFYHVLLLTVSTLTGLGPFKAMIFTNFIALGGFVLAFNLLAGEFTRRTAVRVMGVVLCVFGMNGLFFLFFPLRVARALLGETTGVEVLQRQFSLSPPGYDSAAAFLSVEGNRFLFLDKFMVGTALSITLGLTCVLLALVAIRRRVRWNWIMCFFYGAALTGVLFFHVVAGATIAVAMAGLTGVLFVVGPRGKWNDGEFPWSVQAVFTVLSVAVAAPYIMTVLPHGGESASTGIALQTRQIIGIFACVLPAAIPAVWYLIRGERPLALEGGLSTSGVVAVWAAIVLAVALLVDLPANNEAQFALPLYIALCALAVGGLDRWSAVRSATPRDEDGRSQPRGGGRRRMVTAVAYVAACALPLNAVFFISAFADRSQFRVAGTEWAVYDWIQKTTSEDALFLEARDMVRIPVLSGRDQYWGVSKYAKNWGYPEDEVTVRRALRNAVFKGGDLPDKLFDHVAALDRPFYIVFRDIHDDGGVLFKRFSDDPRFTGRYMTESTVIFEVDLKRR